MYNMNTSISIGSHKLTFRVEILVLIVVVFWLLWGHLLCSCSKMTIQDAFSLVEGVTSRRRMTEGMSGNNMAYTPEFADFKKNDTVIMPPSTWSMPTLLFSPGQTPDAGVKAIWDRKPQPIPLPKGELDMFATTPFKPECCPNTYSISTGCACMTVDQYTYLRDRGGNNVPYSEY